MRDEEDGEGEIRTGEKPERLIPCFISLGYCIEGGQLLFYKFKLLRRYVYVRSFLLQK